MIPDLLEVQEFPARSQGGAAPSGETPPAFRRSPPGYCRPEKCGVGALFQAVSGAGFRSVMARRNHQSATRSGASSCIRVAGGRPLLHVTSGRPRTPDGPRRVRRAVSPRPTMTAHRAGDPVPRRAEQPRPATIATSSPARHLMGAVPSPGGSRGPAPPGPSRDPVPSISRLTVVRVVVAVKRAALNGLSTASTFASTRKKAPARHAAEFFCRAGLIASTGTGSVPAPSAGPARPPPPNGR